MEVGAKATAGASAKMYDFPAAIGKVMLPLPPELAKLAQKGAVDLVTLNGDSLAGIGLFDGDRVLCKTAFSKREITAKTVCIVYIHSENGTFAKKVVFKDGNVILKSFNPNIPDKVHAPDDVVIQGIVLNLLLSPDPSGKFVRTPETKQISRDERGKRIAKAMESFAKPPFEEPF